MGTALTEGRHPGEFLMSEEPGQRSRDNIVIVSGQDLPAGQVLGKITSSGKYAEYNNGASDGTQAAAGILLYATDASAGDVAAAIINCDAEVKGDSLEWGSESGSDITAGIADLLALGIKIR
jgi:hypothetical protein